MTSLLGFTFKQRWQHLLFMHYPVTPQLIQPQLPEGLTVDTHHGMGWLSVVPFKLRYGLPGLPMWLQFNELNLRTYVKATISDSTGVYFFCLDASDVFSVEAARAFYFLNYHRANSQLTTAHLPDDDTVIQFASHRYDKRVKPADFKATYTVGTQPIAEDMTTHRWLTERYRLFSVNPANQTLYTANIAHEPWPLYQTKVRVDHNTLWQAHGFDPPVFNPLCSYTPSLNVTTLPLSRC
jgi:uncharacterized protein